MEHLSRIHSQIATWNVRGQHIILRADLNVPIENNNILDEFRLITLLPTLELLCTHGGIVHVITHRGSPQHPTEELSTAPIAQWFATAGYQPPQVHIHENLRFTAGEKHGDYSFAQTLARGMNWYVEDAFGSLHRHDTSLTILPRLFPHDHRSIGLLIERELQHLMPLVTSPTRPYGMIVGGGKIATKLPYLTQLLDTVDYLFICPGLSSIFLPSHAQYFAPELLALRDHMTLAQNCNRIMLPVDYLVGDTNMNTPYTYKKADEITEHDMPIAIGPCTVQLWLPLLDKLATIVCNGPMGYQEKPETRITLQHLLQHIAQLDAYTVIGGGDMLLATQMCVPHKTFSWYSTGGGSLLALLSRSPLPGLQALNEPYMAH